MEKWKHSNAPGGQSIDALFYLIIYIIFNSEIPL